MTILSKITGLASLIFLSTFSASAIEEDSKKKLSDPYREISRKADTTLSKEAAQFHLMFTENGNFCQKKIQLGVNNLEFAIQPNKLGKYILHVKPGKYKLYFYVEGCDEIITDSVIISSQEIVIAEVHFEKFSPGIKLVEKPVIYVYPEKEMEVSISLNLNGKLGFTYPTYTDGWKFTAKPDGKIKMGDKEYNYLFWDAEISESVLQQTDKKGFLVASDTLLSFLENQLNKMGFNSVESADFITYWYPRMIKNDKNHIHFLFNESCNAYAELSITPQPDHIFRLGMLWCEAKSDFVPEMQIIPSFTRNGFTIVEWGGSEMERIFQSQYFLSSAPVIP